MAAAASGAPGAATSPGGASLAAGGAPSLDTDLPTAQVRTTDPQTLRCGKLGLCACDDLKMHACVPGYMKSIALSFTRASRLELSPAVPSSFRSA